ncbi:hypothetical protein [Thermoflexibacter ruber]|uniref:Uncharacterized protein n=1 Tax=Thermoflexibacter ruber TaxID=1003 RepID=A0A1I2K5B3_9BACT|nr:hypothetical protein [Thermoflexibacter ruber]SFF61538.1 hypothetical protein SAMN04488541_108313 [Thermoflexibacter ruber]
MKTVTISEVEYLQMQEHIKLLFALDLNEVCLRHLVFQSLICV